MRFKTVFLTILFSLFVISGCSNSDSVTAPTSATATAVVATTTPSVATTTPSVAITTPSVATVDSNLNDRNASFPKTITDLTGNSFVLDGIPKNVVSISPAATEILFAIGAGDSVIAVDSYSNFPAETESLPKLGFQDANTEVIVSYGADLVITTGGHEELTQQLKTLGITTVLLDGAVSIDGIYLHISLLGEIMGLENNAEVIITNMKKQIGAIENMLEDVENGPSVFYELDPGLWTVSSDSFIGELLNILKLRNIAADSATSYPQMNLESIIAENPDVILLADFQYGETSESVKTRPGWEVITAVKSDRILEIRDGDIVSRPGPRVGNGLELIGKLIYPDIFD